jgi:hypothetical protein
LSSGQTLRDDDGGIFNEIDGTATLRFSPVSNNRAEGDGAQCGGIFNDDGPMMLIASPVSGNIPDQCAPSG